MLHRLAALTLELAEAVQRQALIQAAAPAADQAPAGLLFTRVARTLRQTIALDARLAADRRSRAAGTAAEQLRHAAAIRTRKRAARRELHRRLQDCVHADPTPRDTDALLRDLEDRLYDEDIDAALTVATVTDIVLTLCAEFGVAPDLSQLTDAELGMHTPSIPARPHPS